MQKPFTYALLLAASLALAACEKTPEDKMQAAKESASQAAASMSDAAKHTAEAIEQKTDEMMGSEPTTGEKAEEAAQDTADAMKEAGEEVKEAIDGQ